MSEADAIALAGERPVTVDSLVADLRRIGVRPGMTLLVHSSLSSIGWVCGGAPAVILALEEVLGPEGTLVMPTHSGDLSDPAFWSEPPVPESWWQPIRDTMLAFDPDLTPTRGMGAIPETFRKQRGVVRSDHPRTSFAAWGKHAGFVTGGHAPDSSLGEASPLARVYDLDGHVLLLGVGHGNNTSLHLAEYRAEYPGKRWISFGGPMVVDGERRWVEMREWICLDYEDFPLLGEAFRDTGTTAEGRIGCAAAQLMRQRDLVDFAVAWMEANRRQPCDMPKVMATDA